MYSSPRSVVSRRASAASYLYRTERTCILTEFTLLDLLDLPCSRYSLAYYGRRASATAATCVQGWRPHRCMSPLKYRVAQEGASEALAGLANQRVPQAHPTLQPKLGAGATGIHSGWPVSRAQSRTKVLLGGVY